MSQQEEDPSRYTRTLVVKPALSQMYDQWLERATRIGKILGSIPGGAALSDPAVSSSIFVGAEREENLIVRFIQNKERLHCGMLVISGQGAVATHSTRTKPGLPLSCRADHQLCCTAEKVRHKGTSVYAGLFMPSEYYH